MRTSMLGGVAVVLALAAGRAAAGTIDTRPATNPLSPLVPGTLGGTFTSDDIHLQSFSLTLSSVGGPSTIAPQVYATDLAGMPIGAPLWTGGLVVLTGAATDYFFFPDLFIAPGSRYWIGATSLAANVAGTSGSFNTWVRVDDPLPTEQIWFTIAPGTPTTPFLPTSVDIATQIVTNPEPGTFALFGLGALGLTVAVRRRRARAPRAV